MPELLTPEHRQTIKHLAAKGANAPLQRRARLLLLYDAGHATAEVTKKVGLSTSSVLRWRRLYREQGMGIFPGHEEQAAPAASETAQPEAAPEAVPEAAKKKKPVKAKKTDKPKKKSKTRKKSKAKKDKAKKKGKAKKGKKNKGKKGKKNKGKKKK